MGSINEQNFRWGFDLTNRTIPTSSSFAGLFDEQHFLCQFLHIRLLIWFCRLWEVLASCFVFRLVVQLEVACVRRNNISVPSYSLEVVRFEVARVRGKYFSAIIQIGSRATRSRSCEGKQYCISVLSHDFEVVRLQVARVRGNNISSVWKHCNISSLCRHFSWSLGNF
jgi:hypothetical protein